MRKKSPRKFSNYLLDRGLQLRYIGFVTAFSVLLCSSLGYLILMQEVDASRAIVTIAESSGLSTEVAGAISLRLSGDDNLLFVKMLAAGVCLVVVLSFYLLVFTHKVAGPLYKVGTYLREMEEGRMGPIHQLRKGDMLQEFYEQFYACHTRVRKRFMDDNDLLSEAVQKVKTVKPEIAGATQQAASHIEKRARSLSTT